MVDLVDFLNKHKEHVVNNQIFVVMNESAIVDYLFDMHGKEILSSFDNRPENTGIAIFFHCPVYCKDIVIVARMKYFEVEDKNGLYMVIIKNAHQLEKNQKERLMLFFNDALSGSPYLQKEVQKNINGHILKSVQVNA